MIEYQDFKNYLKAEYVGNLKIAETGASKGDAFLNTDSKEIYKIIEAIKGETDFNPLEFKERYLKIFEEKYKLSITRDWFIIEAVCSIGELHKVINIMSKRLREWYGLYFPELCEKIKDHEKFVDIIISKNKEEIVLELNVEQNLVAKYDDFQIEQILSYAKQLKAVFIHREEIIAYIEKEMKIQAPNIEAVAGAMVGAKLLSIAGSLEKLSKMPSSTIQILGAEKALFRHLRTNSKPPKYGVIINHALLANAKAKDHGRIARGIAGKISIAAKLDYFKGEFQGDKLKQQLFEKFENLRD